MAYYLTGGDRRGLPDKPLTVQVNFRSHTGVLNVAAAVLAQLFVAFPGAANVLKPDVGLFQGPRPALLPHIPSADLSTLMQKNEGLVVLTHDGNVSRVQELCGDHSVVLGIREAKGMEFKDVAIVDFFSALDSEHQRPWKQLLQTQAQRSSQRGFPELEGHLKLLYTAVTRCCRRLFLVETTRSPAGDAFCRMLQSAGLAEQ